MSASEAVDEGDTERAELPAEESGMTSLGGGDPELAGAMEALCNRLRR